MTQALDDMIAFLNNASNQINFQRITIKELTDHIEAMHLSHDVEVDELERKLKQYETKYGELPNE